MPKLTGSRDDHIDASAIEWLKIIIIKFCEGQDPRKCSEETTVYRHEFGGHQMDSEWENNIFPTIHQFTMVVRLLGLLGN